MKLNFHLGHNPILSQLELDSVLGKGKEITDFNHLNYVCNRLGGLVKVTDQKGKVVWQHSAKSWYRRDRLKPYTNAKKGMLPPKLARIMVNLALKNKPPQGLVLLDPFCGSGTILIEAGILGLSPIGSDIDPKQLSGAKENLIWAKTKDFRLINCDATHISKKISAPVDMIVTEPFMGKANPSFSNIKNITIGLKKLYLGCFKDWFKILKPAGVIVISLPYFQSKNKTTKTSSVIDSISPLGYNVKTRGVNFTRLGAILQREIVIIEKNKWHM